MIASTLDALDGGTRESSRTKRKRDFAYPGSCRKSARTRSSSVSSLEFCSGQSDSGTPARVLPSSVSTVSVLEEELAAAAPPLTPMTVPLSHRPGFFREEGTAGPPSEAEPVPSATQTAEPTWHAEPWASAEQWPLPTPASAPATLLTSCRASGASKRTKTGGKERGEKDKERSEMTTTTTAGPPDLSLSLFFFKKASPTASTRTTSYLPPAAPRCGSASLPWASRSWVPSRPRRGPAAAAARLPLFLLRPPLPLSRRRLL